MSDDTPQRRHTTLGRSYTAGRRQPYLIRKWPGSRWTLPLGPYTLTQLAILVGSIIVLVKTRIVWAHFGPLNLVIGVGLPVVLTYVARRTRLEGRDPVRALLAGATYLLQPRAGYLRGRAWRAPAPVRTPGRGFVIADAVHDDLVVQPDPQAVVYLPGPVTAAGRTDRPRYVSLAELLTAPDAGGH